MFLPMGLTVDHGYCLLNSLNLPYASRQCSSWLSLGILSHLIDRWATIPMPTSWNAYGNWPNAWSTLTLQDYNYLPVIRVIICSFCSKRGRFYLIMSVDREAFCHLGMKGVIVRNWTNEPFWVSSVSPVVKVTIYRALCYIAPECCWGPIACTVPQATPMKLIYLTLTDLLIDH